LHQYYKQLACFDLILEFRYSFQRIFKWNHWLHKRYDYNGISRVKPFGIKRRTKPFNKIRKTNKRPIHTRSQHKPEWRTCQRGKPITAAIKTGSSRRWPYKRQHQSPVRQKHNWPAERYHSNGNSVQQHATRTPTAVSIICNQPPRRNREIRTEQQTQRNKKL